MHRILAIALAFLLTGIPVLAAPKLPPKCTSHSVNANFDDLDPVTGFVGARVPTPYRGLYFQGFFYAQRGDISQPGLFPHSSPGYGLSGSSSQTTGGTAMLSTNYPDSNITSFDLQSFYFGVVLASSGGLAGAPQQAYLSVVAYVGQDNQVNSATQVCAQQFIYNPTTWTGPQQMTLAAGVKSCFKNVNFIFFTWSLTGGMSVGNGASALGIDDVKYTYRSCP